MRQLIHWLLLLQMMSVCQASSLPAAADSRFLVDHWTQTDGLPTNGVNAVEQTPDGFLWLATFAGIVRFDGTHFDVFDRSNTPELPGNRFVRIIYARGYLWLETESRHLVRRTPDGRFELVDERLGLPGSQIRAWLDSDDGFFVGTFSGVAQLTPDGRFVPLVPSFTRHVTALALHPAGGLAVGTLQDGLYQLDAGAARPIPAAQALRSITSLKQHDGRLAVGAKNGIAMLDGDRLLSLVRNDDAQWQGTQVGYSGAFFALFNDAVFEWGDGQWVRGGRLDIGPINRGRLRIQDAGHGQWNSQLNRLLRDGQVVMETGSDRITDLLLDGHDQVWATLAGGGLARIRDRLVQSIPLDAAGGDGNVYSIIEDGGHLLVGSQSPDYFVVDPSSQPAQVRLVRNAGSALAMLRDSHNQLWIAGMHRCVVQEGDCKAVPALDAIVADETVRVIFEDSRQGLWMGLDRGLAYRPERGEWQRIPLPFGKGYAPIRAALQLPDGALWFASNGAGVLMWRDGAFKRAVDATSGLSSNRVRSLWYDKAHDALWVGTEDSGLCRITAPRVVGGVACIGTDKGLWDGSIHRMISDEGGQLWMSTNRGLFMAEIGSLNAVADGRADWVVGIGFGARDGMIEAEANGGVQSAGIRATDGRLWFPTQAGIVGIDPSGVTQGETTRPLIDRVAFNGLEQWGDRPIRLEGSRRSIDVAFSAPTLRGGGRLRYRYRLQGLEARWTLLGSQRLVSITALPPGNFVLEVEVSRTDGAWGGATARLPVTVVPLFTETIWFPLLLGLLAIALVSVGFLYRLRRARIQRRVLENVVRERTAELQLALEEARHQKHQVEVAAEARTRLFGSISHELRTPLTLMLGPLEERAQQRRPVTESDEAMLLRNTRRIKEMVDQILDLERIESGHVSLDIEDVDVGALLSAQSDAFGFVAARKSIQWRLAVADDCLVAADRRELEKVVSNLCSNAIKFTPENGDIWIRCRCEAEEVLITVEDTGPGIPEEQRDEAFARFSRLKRDAGIDGTGIGLSLVRELVEMHGGSVTVDASPDLGGARFTIRLARREAVVAPLTGISGSQRILVVDDNEDLRAYVRSLLEPQFQVLEASNGNDGLAMARELLPDAIICDVMMPGMDGVAAVRELRRGGDEATIPVLFLTARGGASDEIVALAAGGDHFLAKPFNSDVLLARLRSLLALRERFARNASIPELHCPFDSLRMRIRDVVLSHLDNAELGVNEVAKALFMSRSALFRQLKLECQQTPTEFIRDLRLDIAESWLMDSNASVSEIAFAAGFGSLSSFGRAFRDRFGCSASAFRERHASERERQNRSADRIA